MNRRLKIVFTLSVLLNVLLIGVVAGACYKRMDRHSAFSESRDPQLSSKIIKAMRDTRKEQEAVHKQMKDAKEDLFEVMAAPVFDEAEFNAVSEKMVAAQAALFKARNEATLNLAKSMTAEERQKMAVHMKAMSGKRDRYKGEWSGKGERSSRPQE